MIHAYYIVIWYLNKNIWKVFFFFRRLHILKNVVSSTVPPFCCFILHQLTCYNAKTEQDEEEEVHQVLLYNALKDGFI